jgi:hypothetical protein
MVLAPGYTIEHVLMNPIIRLATYVNRYLLSLRVYATVECWPWIISCSESSIQWPHRVLLHVPVATKSHDHLQPNQRSQKTQEIRIRVPGNHRSDNTIRVDPNSTMYSTQQCWSPIHASPAPVFPAGPVSNPWSSQYRESGFLQLSQLLQTILVDYHCQWWKAHS